MKFIKYIQQIAFKYTGCVFLKKKAITSITHVMSNLRVLNQFSHSICQQDRLIFGNEKAIVSIHNHIRNCTDWCRNNGERMLHSFQ